MILLGDNAFALPPESPNSVVRAARPARSSSPAPAPRPAAPGPPPPTTRSPCASGCSARPRSASTAGDTAPLVVTAPDGVARRGRRRRSSPTSSSRGSTSCRSATSPPRSATGVPAATSPTPTTDVADELDAADFTAATRATDTATAARARAHAADHHRGPGARRGAGDPVRAAPRPAPRWRRGRAAAIEDSAARRARPRSRSRHPPRSPCRATPGTLGTTLVNGLDQPVTVQVAATTDGELTLTGDTRARARSAGAERGALRGHHRPARASTASASPSPPSTAYRSGRPTSCRSVRPGSAPSSGS